MRTWVLVVNGVIALDYFAISLYWIHQLRIPLNGSSSRGSLVVVIAAAVFFMTCAHTHVDILLAMASDQEVWDHWLSWGNALSHTAQGIAGGVFAIGASHWIHVRVFDRQQYDRAVRQALTFPTKVEGHPLRRASDYPPDFNRDPTE